MGGGKNGRALDKEGEEKILTHYKGKTTIVDKNSMSVKAEIFQNNSKRDLKAHNNTNKRRSRGLNKHKERLLLW